MRPRDPNDEEPRNDEAIHERALLNKLHLDSFTASPAAVVPFQPSTLTWVVTVPVSVSNEIDVTFTVGNHEVPASGSLPVTPLATGAFELVAHSPLSSRVMGFKVVNVDTSDLVEGSLPRASIQFSAQVVKTLFSGVGSLSSRGDLSVEMLPPDGVRLKVPLEVSIPNYFDADIDVDLDVRLSVKSQPNGNRVASARLSDVSVDVSFAIAEHIFSFGTAAAVQAIVEPLAADLIEGFLGPQIESQFTQPLQKVLDFFLAGWRGADPTHRVYRLYSIVAEPEGLVIRGAPVPAATGHGRFGGVLGENGTVVVMKKTTRRAKTTKATAKRRGAGR